MLDRLKYNEEGQALIVDLYAWMDGGTVTVRFASENGDGVEVEFVQKVFFEDKQIGLAAGSLVIDNGVVSLRSELEKQVIDVCKRAIFSDEVSLEDRQFKVCLEEAIAFVESDDYILTAKKVGRLT